MEIAGKVALITGAIGGIGFVTVQCLLKSNIKYVALMDLRKSDDLLVIDSLKTLEKEFTSDRFGYYCCSVTDVKEFKKCYQATTALAGYVDILINNAGVGNDKNIDLTIDVNFLIAILESSDVDVMKNGRGGVIVNVASLLGLINSQMSPLYYATKHTIVSFEQNRKFGVRIVCICPHATNTNMMSHDNVKNAVFDFVDLTSVREHSTRPLQKPENVAKAIVEIVKKGTDGAVWVSQHDLPPFPVEEDTLSHLGVEL